MSKKRVLKFFKSFFSNDYIKIVLYLLGFVLIFIFWRVINSDDDVLPTILDILKGDVAVSVFIAGLLSILAKHLIMMVESALEESLKTEDNHHKIIYKYDGHHSESVDLTKNYYDKLGNYMAVHNAADSVPKNPIKDVHSSEYKKLDEEIGLYRDHGVLRLPTVNIYTNIIGDCRVRFDDSLTDGEIPSFIINNAGSIFKAHKHSRTTNNVTVRLKDISLDGETLTLRTERSNYYRMLLTNRCMDYELENGMTVRNLFEYKKAVTPLTDSKMSNQIGINGVILTRDGYLLIEKRDRKKTTWKNKFAQPISLALKEDDLCEKGKHTVGDSVEEANERMFAVIKKTMKSNFGLTENDYDPLCFEKNFLGVARDLLEGGKPNLYFSVTVNYDAQEFLRKLRHAATKSGKDSLKTEKLSAEYYLVPFELMKFNFNYEMSLPKKRIYRVDRYVYPRVNRFKVGVHRAKYFFCDLFSPNLERECGEALLVCYAYLELCRGRIDAIGSK